MTKAVPDEDEEAWNPAAAARSFADIIDDPAAPKRAARAARLPVGRLKLRYPDLETSWEDVFDLAARINCQIELQRVLRARYPDIASALDGATPPDPPGWTRRLWFPRSALIAVIAGIANAKGAFAGLPTWAVGALVGGTIVLVLTEARVVSGWTSLVLAFLAIGIGGAVAEMRTGQDELIAEIEVGAPPRMVATTDPGARVKVRFRGSAGKPIVIVFARVVVAGRACCHVAKVAISQKGRRLAQGLLGASTSSRIGPLVLLEDSSATIAVTPEGEDTMAFAVGVQEAD